MLTLTNIIFLFIAITIIFSAIIVAFSKNILYSAFALLFTLLGVAGLYFYLNAAFIACLQIMIYVGGILVLILFAIMLTQNIKDVNITNKSVNIGLGSFLLIIGIGVLSYILARANWQNFEPVYTEKSIKILGNLLLTEYIFPFEIISVLLLAGLIGAVVIARKSVK
jgi:NADH-quinone oxidoreductase subunit J